MSNPYYNRVQQKLAHGRLLLELLEAAPASRPAREALGQGVVVHLAVAVRLYLRELAVNLGALQPEKVLKPEDLQGLFPASGLVAALRTHAAVTSLLQLEAGILSPAIAGVPGKAVTPTQVIASDSGVAGEVSLSSPDAGQLRAWHDDLQSLFEQQRLGFVEC